ncbi:MAG TPA: hypothetical protein VG078_11725, partial [Acidimicrobiales bacterium]|nr:hypothetical protein [Acidimicrobiales bacterium]
MRHQVILADLLHVDDDATGVAEAGPLDGVAHAAAVGEAGLLHAPLEVHLERLVGALGEVAEAAQQFAHA